MLPFGNFLSAFVVIFFSKKTQNIPFPFILYKENCVSEELCASFCPLRFLIQQEFDFLCYFRWEKKGFRVLSKLKISFFGWILSEFPLISLLDSAGIRFPMSFPVEKKGFRALSKLKILSFGWILGESPLLSHLCSASWFRKNSIRYIISGVKRGSFRV